MMLVRPWGIGAHLCGTSGRMEDSSEGLSLCSEITVC